MAPQKTDPDHQECCQAAQAGKTPKIVHTPPFRLSLRRLSLCRLSGSRVRRKKDQPLAMY